MDSFNKKINILYLAGQNRSFKKFQKFLRDQSIDCNLVLSNSIFEIQQYDSFLEKCDLIICELFYNRILIEDAAELFDKLHPQSFILGLTQDDTIPIEMYETSAALRLTDIIKINLGWKRIWKKIEEALHFYTTSALSLRINEIPVSNLLEMVENSKWTSIITIHDYSFSLTSGNIRGCIYFRRGQPEMAWSSDNFGERAIYDFLSLTEGYAHVYHTPQGHFVRNVTRSIQQIMMTYYIREDENSPHCKTV